MKKIIIIISSIFFVGICLFMYVYAFRNPFLKFSLIGKKQYKIEVNSKYEENGVTASIFNKDIKKNVKVKNNSNLKKVGSYKITYKLTYLKNVKILYRIIKVVDTTSPEIKLNGDSEVTIIKGNKYEEKGVNVNDNYDANLDEKIEIISNLDINKVGEYEITYKVKDSSNNEASVKRKVIVKDIPKVVYNDIGNYDINSISKNEPTYINGILLVNKKYGLPANFGGGIDPTALSNLHTLQADAKAAGFNIPTLSAYRSYETQRVLYNNYYARDGSFADTYSARPGHSEHQTGLAFDVGSIDNNYGNTEAGKWLNLNCMNYGFIIRYPKGKENITGYQYEPWHIRYVGVSVATDIMNRKITLEEYLGV